MSEGSDAVPITERPEWADGSAQPRPLPPSSRQVAAIGRDELTGPLMDYFWGAVAAGERRCAWQAQQV